MREFSVRSVDLPGGLASPMASLDRSLAVAGLLGATLIESSSHHQ
jgi:hypothetical protein